MNDSNESNNSGPENRTTEAAADERLGYARPPKATQFKPGKSGNPKGRPKGSQNEATLIKQLLERKLEMRTKSGAPRKMTVMAVMLQRLVEKALLGDFKAAQFLLDRIRLQQQTPPVESLNADDEALLRSYEAELALKFSKGGGL